MSNGNSETDLVAVTPRTNLTFHQLQDVYSTLTGKSEKISSRFSKSHRIEFTDFENLHARIRSCCESYGTKIQNESVSVYHINGQSEQFSSFDRFRVYNQSSTSPVENVNVEYNFIIIPSGSTEPKKYKISIGIPSRLAIYEKQPDLAVGPLSILSMLGRVNGGFQIEFSDYAVARHYQTQIEEWYEALEFSAESRALATTQKFSHWFKSVFALIGILVVSYSFQVPAAKLMADPITNVDLSNRLVFFGAAIATVYFLAKFSGRLVEWGIDRIQPASFVRLNKGDDRLIQNAAKSKLGYLALTLGGFATAIITNIVATKIIENFL